jgi:aminopeptidase N
MMDFMNVISMHEPAFKVDAKNTTRAMFTNVLRPDEIGALFDTVAYDKCE